MEGVARLLGSLALTAGEIAKTARLPVARIRALMEGAPPELGELRALSRALRVPMRAFATGLRPADAEGPVGLLFRGAANVALPNQRATVDYVAGFVDAALRILPRRDSPPVWLQEMRPKEQTFAEAHRIAHRFRVVFMPEEPDDPFTELPQIVADTGGIIVSRLQFSRYEGASVVAGNYGFVFVSPRFSARMLFTAAHELGHILAHHGRDAEAVFDTMKRIGAWRQATLAERFVDAFASVLLLPERGVAKALKAIREALQVTTGDVGDVQLLYLARFFGVSFEVAARRCEQLGLLPVGGAYSLTEKLKKDFGNPERRADELGLPARPKILLSRISMNLARPLIEQLEAGVVSTGWAAESFGLTIDELFDLHARLVRERSR